LGKLETTKLINVQSEGKVDDIMYRIGKKRIADM
jgi:hypothetical protein